MNTCDPSDAVRLKSTILQLLESLGEHIPPNMSEEGVESEVASAIESFEIHSDQDHLHMYTNVDNSNQTVIIQAYAILALLASITNAHTPRYYVARWIQFCLNHKVASKHIPGEIPLLVFFHRVLLTAQAYSHLNYLLPNVMKRRMFHSQQSCVKK